MVSGQHVLCLAMCLGLCHIGVMASSETEKILRPNSAHVVRHFIADRKFMDYIDGIDPSATFESHVASHPAYKQHGNDSWSIHMVPDDVVDVLPAQARQDSLLERCVSFAANSVGIIANSVATGGFITTIYNTVFVPCKIQTLNGKADDGTSLNVYYTPDPNTACSDRLAQNKIEEALRNACDGFNQAGMNAGCIYIGEGSKSSGQFRLSTGTLNFGCGRGRQVCTNIPDDQGGHDDLRRNHHKRGTVCGPGCPGLKKSGLTTGVTHSSATKVQAAALTCPYMGGECKPACQECFEMGCDNLGVYGNPGYEMDDACKNCACS